MWYSEVRTAPVARCGKIWNFQLPALVVDHATTPARSHLNRHSTAPLATIFFSQGDETLFFFVFFCICFQRNIKYCLFFLFFKGLWHCFVILFKRIMALFSCFVFSKDFEIVFFFCFSKDYDIVFLFCFFKGLWNCFLVLFFQRIMKLFSCFVFTKDYDIVFCFDFPRNMKYLFVVFVVYKDR